MIQISGKCQILKDSKEQSYFGVNIEAEQYATYADFMTNKNFHEEIALKLKRDNGFYHVTVFNTAQWGSLNKKGVSEELLKHIEGRDFSFTVHGIGKAEKDENKSYFVILENEELAQIRKQFNLSPHDFHMTLAFKEKDVFGVSKNRESCIFNNNEIFNFQQIKKRCKI